MTPETMAALHARAFTDAAPRPWSAAEFARLLAEPSTLVAVRPEGIALGRAAAGEGELMTLAVSPEARRQGIGAALLEAFEAAARTAGARMLFLEVAESNTSARALYARAGWVAAGRRPRYYAAPSGGSAVDALVLHKALIAEAELLPSA